MIACYWLYEFCEIWAGKWRKAMTAHQARVSLQIDANVKRERPSEVSNIEPTKMAPTVRSGRPSLGSDESHDRTKGNQEQARMGQSAFATLVLMIVVGFALWTLLTGDWGHWVVALIAFAILGWLTRRPGNPHR